MSTRSNVGVSYTRSKPNTMRYEMMRPKSAAKVPSAILMIHTRFRYCSSAFFVRGGRFTPLFCECVWFIKVLLCREVYMESYPMILA